MAYENHIVQGGPAPGAISEDLSDQEKQELAAARQAIDALHGVFTQDRVAAEPATPEQPQRQLGDFRILHEIGRGGMGVVYEAEQVSMGRRVALKVLPFAAMLDTQQLNRFKNEARAVGTLNHPNIVAVHSVGTERGVHYYAMQLIEGESLAELIAELRKAKRRVSAKSDLGAGAQGRSDQSPSESPTELFVVSPAEPPTESPAKSPLSLVPDTKREIQAALSTALQSDRREYFHHVARLGIQAAQALDHAHQNGVVHRDVKPGNLLLDADCKLWVADFGLARIEADAGMTLSGDILGTLHYMSPEQALGNRAVIDHRTDVYSLGATLYELLTLRPLFEGHDRQELIRKIAQEQPRQPAKLNPRIPADLETIVLKAIAKDPSDRYDTAQAMADDLCRFRNGKPVQARRIHAGQRFWRWSKRNPMVAVLSMSVFAILMLGLSWHNHRLGELLTVSNHLRAESVENARQYLRARYVS
ncbi:MAG: serine/threonine-protein kinase, partial [Pirellulales bacterium]